MATLENILNQYDSSEHLASVGKILDDVMYRETLPRLELVDIIKLIKPKTISHDNEISIPNLLAVIYIQLRINEKCNEYNQAAGMASLSTSEFYLGSRYLRGVERSKLSDETKKKCISIFEKSIGHSLELLDLPNAKPHSLRYLIGAYVESAELLSDNDKRKARYISFAIQFGEYWLDKNDIRESTLDHLSRAYLLHSKFCENKDDKIAALQNVTDFGEWAYQSGYKTVTLLRNIAFAYTLLAIYNPENIIEYRQRHKKFTYLARELEISAIKSSIPC